MDLSSLTYLLDVVCGNGLSLCTEQRTALHISLLIMKKNYNLTRVLFWGKILGINNNYFIAQGVEEDEIKDKKSFYSFNCMDWHLLPHVTEDMAAQVAVVAHGRFMGEPSHIYEKTETRRLEKDEDVAVEEELMMKVTEENRLAVTVSIIDKEVAVVPRGAYIKSPHGTVQTNRSFKGLDLTEAGKLNNYFHFSPPVNLKKKSILEMADLNPSIDFLDPLSEDIPKGSWSMRFEYGSRVCVIRSLLWLGQTFYHVPATSEHGYIYMGDGHRNLDLLFTIKE